MKRTCIFLLLLFIALFHNIGTVSSQNLLVGFTDPNEVLNINASSHVYDTVFLVNNGTLNISNQAHFTVNTVLALLDSSNLIVNTSYLEVNSLLLLKDNSSAILSDSLKLPCNIYVTGQSTLNIDSAALNIPMTYKSQFGWWGLDNAGFNISNSTCQLGAGALQGAFLGNSVFNQHNNNFISSILPMTLSFSGGAKILIDSCYGGMEFIINDSVDLQIYSSELFVIWYSFSDGDTAKFSYPAANSTTFPLASDISTQYLFSDSLPDVKGVDFNLKIQNSTGVYWGVLSNPGSFSNISNSLVLACGFLYTENTLDSASGFINAQLYPSYTSPFTDRHFSVVNTTVMAWNFYPADSSQLIIDACIYGESLGLGYGITKVYNSTCDGTGGYFGGMANSKTYVYNSNIIRQSGNAQIINYNENAKAWIHNSTIVGDIVVSDNAQLIIGNTLTDKVAVTNNNAYFAEMWLDTISNIFVDSSISVNGRVIGINGLVNTSSITRYIAAYSMPDSSGLTVIKDSTASSISIVNNKLFTWNTQGTQPGNYLLWLTMFVDGDSAISCNRIVEINSATGLPQKDRHYSVNVFPNPGKESFNVDIGNNKKQINHIVELLSATGKLVFTNEYNSSPFTVPRNGLPSGLYFYRIVSEEGGIYSGKVVFE